jgi:hypothetical protein
MVALQACTLGARWAACGTQRSAGLSSDARLCCSAPRMMRVVRMLRAEAGHGQAAHQLAGGGQRRGAGAMAAASGSISILKPGRIPR